MKVLCIYYSVSFFEIEVDRMGSSLTLETLSLVLILVRILSVMPSSALAAGTKLHPLLALLIAEKLG